MTKAIKLPALWTGRCMKKHIPITIELGDETVFLLTYTVGPFEGAAIFVTNQPAGFSIWNPMQQCSVPLSLKVEGQQLCIAALPPDICLTNIAALIPLEAKKQTV